MNTNSEERHQQGYVNIVRKGVNKVVKTDHGYKVKSEYDNLSPLDKLKAYLYEGALDLHLHSNSSDGYDSPPALLTKVMQHGLKTFAVTDHDTLWGVGEVRMILDKLMQIHVPNLPRFVPGVELNVEFEEQEIHLLAYFPDGGEEGMQDFLDRSKAMRIARNRELCALLTELGFPLRYEDLMKEGGQVLGRMHVANLMTRRGYVGSVDEAFDRYLSEGKPGYIGRSHPMMEEALKLVLAQGGVPVLAHPMLYGWVEAGGDGGRLRGKLKTLQAMGCQGVEVVHGETPLEVSATVAEVARELGLLKTIGSDYHGSNKPGVEMYRSFEDYAEYLLD